MKTDNLCLAAALAAFPFEGKITGLEPFGSGHINDTYAVYVQGAPEPGIGYVLQRLNTNVFKKPDQVMQNIVGVTEYLHETLRGEGRDAERCALHFLKTYDGQMAFYDSEGMPWRSYCFIPASFCYQECPTAEIFYQSARAFGDFLRLLENYPADTLHETIPGFHDTVARYEAFERIVVADPVGRVAACTKEIEFVRARAADCGLLVEMQKRGELPLRVTHNDTKLNNVLFDHDTGDAICIIDLDTIMPGLALNDYGDAVRFGATEAAEDERDLSKVHFSLPLFEAFTKGYLETAGPSLTAAEIEMMPQGARLLTLECGMRFLGDHLDGDNYFKVEREGQNLDRGRTQFKLVADMEDCFGEMQRVVEKHTPKKAAVR